jgi:hypothetical protein
MSRSFGRKVVHPPVADQDVAGRHLFEPRDHPQERGLPAAGRADKHDEFALRDLEVDAVDHLHRAVVLAQAPDGDFCHMRPDASPRRAAPSAALMDG